MKEVKLLLQVRAILLVDYGNFLLNSLFYDETLRMFHVQKPDYNYKGHLKYSNLSKLSKSRWVRKYEYIVQEY